MPSEGGWSHPYHLVRLYLRMQMEIFATRVKRVKKKSKRVDVRAHHTRRVSYLTPGIPRIVIEGKWLRQLGVRVGDEVYLDYFEDRIVIRFV